ncbi:Cyclopropane-fatty-acyl-phospholipid synthase [Purpureocillium takamizusanense]|uniref:Cyclopropane-fatty-acyl-phospholipid synthase n=1 Tax=Purpureocillium takamizusanense TaxID=2060973 RepID=A0A9Q8VF19_9HYPO|nr:Cyclopropane-fatty-acyl-phospholipid synthase [Purpureocillium takamizusanense]UNI23193.1 Cyclopropane-fatty-acyl-phospholipid synthase [Purpureocillium takamizusanense]
MQCPALFVGLFRPTLIRVAKRMLSAALQGIEHGQLKITYPAPGSEQSPGRDDVTFGSGTPLATVHVKDDWFWVRVLASGSVGFAEAYVNGEIDIPDLLAIFKLALLNRRLLTRLDKRSPFLTKLYSLLATTNGIEEARRNAAAHYDLSNDMFAAFLSPDMTYSCPLWLPPHDPDYANDDLEKAQRRKLSYHIKAARIKASDHVLEIGTGWGSFAIQAVQETGCTVTTITLSKEQKALAKKRIDAAGLSSKIKVLLCDYREIPKLGIRFDKVVSIEMLEHTGIEHLREYFGVIKEVLPGEDAIATVQATMMSETVSIENVPVLDRAALTQGPLGTCSICRIAKEQIVSSPNTSAASLPPGIQVETYRPWLSRVQIFPGAYPPSLLQTLQAIDKGSGDHFIVDRVETFGGLGRAFQEWGEAFGREFDSRIRPALVAGRRQLCDVEVEEFRRKWQASCPLFYFAYCQAAFEAQTVRTVTIRLVRTGARILAQDYYE